MSERDDIQLIDAIIEWIDETDERATRAYRRLSNEHLADEYFSALNHGNVSTASLETLKTKSWLLCQSINRFFNYVADWSADRKEETRK